MPSWDDVEVGDKVVVEVRATIREVHPDDPDGLCFCFEEGKQFEFVVDDATDTLKSVEKPVRTFKPGDVVRPKGRGRDLLYVVPASGEWLTYIRENRVGSMRSGDYRVIDATSEKFELV